MLRRAFIRGCSSGNNVCDVFEKIGGERERERDVRGEEFKGSFFGGEKKMQNESRDV